MPSKSLRSTTVLSERAFMGFALLASSMIAGGSPAQAAGERGAQRPEVRVEIPAEPVVVAAPVVAPPVVVADPVVPAVEKTLNADAARRMDAAAASLSNLAPAAGSAKTLATITVRNVAARNAARSAETKTGSAAHEVTVDMHGDGLINYQVVEPAAAAALAASVTIGSKAGSAALNALTSDAVLDQSINLASYGPLVEGVSGNINVAGSQARTTDSSENAGVAMAAMHGSSSTETSSGHGTRPVDPLGNCGLLSDHCFHNSSGSSSSGGSSSGGSSSGGSSSGGSSSGGSSSGGSSSGGEGGGSSSGGGSGSSGGGASSGPDTFIVPFSGGEDPLVTPLSSDPNLLGGGGNGGGGQLAGLTPEQLGGLSPAAGGNMGAWDMSSSCMNAYLQGKWESPAQEKECTGEIAN